MGGTRQGLEMESVAGILSDLDGTLVDTKQANFRAYRAALRDVGVPFTWEAFEPTWGQDSRHFLPRIAPHLTAEEVLQVRRAKAEHYSHFFDSTRLNEPLIRLFRTLHPRIRFALVTTAKRRNATEILEFHGIAGLFDVVVCGEDSPVSKPGAEPYVLALELLGLQAAECLAFEDSPSGIASAEAAGIGVVTVRF